MAVNKCIKYSLFFFNLLFWISGCIILGISIYLKVSKDGKQITSVTVLGAHLLIAIGIIIMVLGFLGCCGAIRESRCMLILFFTGLLLIFILLLATGILGALWKDKSQDLIKKELEGVHLSNATQKVQAEVQALEKKGRCCGLTNGPSDWGTVVPPSCDCVDESAACETVSERKLYKTPCIEFLKSFMKQHLTVLLGVAFAIAVLLIFGMTFAITLYCQVGKRETTTA